MIIVLSCISVCLFVFGMYLVAELAWACKELDVICERMETICKEIQDFKIRLDTSYNLSNASCTDIYKWSADSNKSDEARLQTATDETNYSSKVDTCVSCGAIIPEGRHICPKCEKEF